MDHYSLISHQPAHAYPNPNPIACFPPQHCITELKGIYHATSTHTLVLCIYTIVASIMRMFSSLMAAAKKNPQNPCLLLLKLSKGFAYRHRCTCTLMSMRARAACSPKSQARRTCQGQERAPSGVPWWHTQRHTWHASSRLDRPHLPNSLDGSCMHDDEKSKDSLPFALFYPREEIYDYQLNQLAAVHISCKESFWYACNHKQVTTVIISAN